MLNAKSSHSWLSDQVSLQADATNGPTLRYVHMPEGNLFVKYIL